MEKNLSPKLAFRVLQVDYIDANTLGQTPAQYPGLHRIRLPIRRQMSCKVERVKLQTLLERFDDAKQSYSPARCGRDASQLLRMRLLVVIVIFFFGFPSCLCHYLVWSLGISRGQ